VPVGEAALAVVEGLAVAEGELTADVEGAAVVVTGAVVLGEVAVGAVEVAVVVVAVLQALTKNEQTSRITSAMVNFFIFPPLYLPIRRTCQGRLTRQLFPPLKVFKYQWINGSSNTVHYTGDHFQTATLIHSVFNNKLPEFHQK
jgi:hypothetical protein